MDQQSEGNCPGDHHPLPSEDIEHLRAAQAAISPALKVAIDRLNCFASHDGPTLAAALRFADASADYDIRLDLQERLEDCARAIRDAALANAIIQCANVVDHGACLIENITGCLADRPGNEFVEPQDVAKFLAWVEALPPAVPAHRPDIDGLIDFAAAPSSIEPLIHGLMNCGESGMVIGAPGGGKTTLTVDASLAVATGSTWRGELAKAGAVVYIAAEDSPGVAARARAWCVKHGFDIADVPFFVIDQTFDLASRESTKRLIATIEAVQVRARRIVRLCVLDTLAKSMTEDENSTEVAGRVVANIGRIRRATGASVLTLHHMDKQGKGSRGSVALPGDADLIVTIAKGTATVSKRRNGPDGWGFGFTIAPVMTADGAEIGPVIEYIPEAVPKRVPKPGAAARADDKLVALVEAVREAHAAGRPFKVHRAGGLYARRVDLPTPLSSMGRDALVGLAQAGIDAGVLVSSRGTLSSPTSH